MAESQEPVRADFMLPTNPGPKVPPGIGSMDTPGLYPITFTILSTDNGHRSMIKALRAMGRRDLNYLGEMYELKVGHYGK